MKVSPKGLRPIHFIVGMVLGLAVALLVYNPVRGVPRTFYVSRGGNNADGLSWGTAWNELSRINWAVVQPGDTILIDGGPTACPALGPGSNCGMTYNTTLSISKSGRSGAPITIRLAPDNGRNGTVIIDGGLTNWNSCAEYASEPTPPSTGNGTSVRDTGIDLNNSQWVVINGTKWGGIEIRNHKRYGLNLGSSQRSLARYLKIHHNTDPADTTNNSVGITQGWESQYDTVSRVEVFRNGQDAVRVSGDYFTLEESYIHDHYCNHPDGIQSFVPTSNDTVPDNAGEVRGLVVRRNVWDKIGMQTIFLGENAGHNSWNVDVTIHDNLFLNSDYVIKSKHGGSRNWNIYNNTVVNAQEFAVEWCCATPGTTAPMTIRNNVFVNVKPGNSAFYLPTGSGNTAFTDNCLHNVGGRWGNVSESGTVTADPSFANSGSGNFALAGGSPCAGKGASITSVNQLLSLACNTATAQDVEAMLVTEGFTTDTTAPIEGEVAADGTVVTDGTVPVEGAVPADAAYVADPNISPEGAAITDPAAIQSVLAAGPIKVFLPLMGKAAAAPPAAPPQPPPTGGC